MTLLKLRRSWQTLHNIIERKADNHKECCTHVKNNFSQFVVNVLLLCFCFVIFCLNILDNQAVKSILYKPRHEKACLLSLRPGKTQTGLLNCRYWLET